MCDRPAKNLILATPQSCCDIPKFLGTFQQFSAAGDKKIVYQSHGCQNEFGTPWKSPWQMWHFRIFEGPVMHDCWIEWNGTVYCTISFNLDKGVTCDTLSTILVSDIFQNNGDRVILPPTQCQSRLISLFSIGTHQCFRTRAMWHRTLVTFWTIWRGLWHVTSELNEVVQ